MSEVSADFTFFPPIGQGDEPIIADVIFSDNFANEHRVRTQFTYLGPKPPQPIVASPELKGRVG
jgi:hypothetical protein